VLVGTTLSLPGMVANLQIEWVSGDLVSVAEWEFGSTSDNIFYHKIWKQEQQVFNEFSDRAQWGNWVSFSLNSTVLKDES
jgi:hypothetical protein